MFGSPTPSSARPSPGASGRGQILERGDAGAVPAGRHVRDQQEALAPMIEHDRPVDDEEPDRRTGRFPGGEGVAVEEHRRLVRQETDQPSGQRREPLDARRVQSLRELDEIGARVARPRHVESEVASDVLDVHALLVHDDDRRRIARDERVPTPALGALHALQQDAGTVAGECGEHADRRRDVGQQLRPHGDEPVRPRERIEGLAIRPNLHVITSWSRTTANPGKPARGSHRDASVFRAREPRRQTPRGQDQRFPRSAIWRRWSHRGPGLVNARRAMPG
jgi:hypothetical protein